MHATAPPGYSLTGDRMAGSTPPPDSETIQNEGAPQSKVVDVQTPHPNKTVEMAPSKGNSGWYFRTSLPFLKVFFDQKKHGATPKSEKELFG